MSQCKPHALSLFSSPCFLHCPKSPSQLSKLHFRCSGPIPRIIGGRWLWWDGSWKAAYVKAKVYIRMGKWVGSTWRVDTAHVAIATNWTLKGKGGECRIEYSLKIIVSNNSYNNVDLSWIAVLTWERPGKTHYLHWGKGKCLKVSGVPSKSNHKQLHHHHHYPEKD